MGSASAVGVDNNLAAGEAGVACGAADHELAGGVHMQDEVLVEQGLKVFWQGGDEAREYDLAYILLYTRVHFVIRSELIVLGAEHYGVHAHGLVGFGRELDGELALGVRPQVGDFAGMPYLRKDLEQRMRQGEGERHVLRGVLAGKTEHHTLVAGALLVLGTAHHAAVDVGALLVDGADYPAAGGVEAVFRLGVADAGYGGANRSGDVYVGIVAAHLAAYYDKACGAESFHCHLGLGVLAEEFIEDGI